MNPPAVGSGVGRGRDTDISQLLATPRDKTSLLQGTQKMSFGVKSEKLHWRNSNYT